MIFHRLRFFCAFNPHPRVQTGGNRRFTTTARSPKRGAGVENLCRGVRGRAGPICHDFVIDTENRPKPLKKYSYFKRRMGRELRKFRKKRY